MYSEKSVRPWMEFWGAPELTGYSCKDLQYTITWSHILLRKHKIKPNTWPETLKDNWSRGLETMLESMQKTIFLEMIKESIIYKFLKDLPTTERRLTGPKNSLSSTFLNIGTLDETFQKSRR